MMNVSVAAKSHEGFTGWWRGNRASSRAARDPATGAGAKAHGPARHDPANTDGGSDGFASTEWADTEWSDTCVDI